MLPVVGETSPIFALRHGQHFGTTLETGLGTTCRAWHNLAWLKLLTERQIRMACHDCVQPKVPMEMPYNID